MNLGTNRAAYHARPRSTAQRNLRGSSSHMGGKATAPAKRLALHPEQPRTHLPTSQIHLSFQNDLTASQKRPAPYCSCSLPRTRTPPLRPRDRSASAACCSSSTWISISRYLAPATPRAAVGLQRHGSSLLLRHAPSSRSPPPGLSEKYSFC